MMVTLKLGIIGAHFFCFRTVNDIARLVKKTLEFAPKCRQIRKRELAAKSARGKGGRVAELVPEAKPGHDLLAELRQSGQVATHKAHHLPQSPHTVLGLTHSLCGPCNLLCLAIERGEVKAEGHPIFATLAHIPLPVRAIAAHEQACLYQPGEVTAHRRARHAVQPLADRLVGWKDDHFGVAAKHIVRKEAEKSLKNGQIALRNPKCCLRLGQLAEELPLVDGLAWNRGLGPLDHAQMGVRYRPHKRRNRCVIHDVIHEGKISLARESLCACGKGARSLHSEVRKLKFCSGLVPCET